MPIEGVGSERCGIRGMGYCSPHKLIRHGDVAGRSELLDGDAG